jgi:predicted GIY-YIG superfamily endonuclease
MPVWPPRSATKIADTPKSALSQEDNSALVRYPGITAAINAKIAYHGSAKGASASRASKVRE